MKEQKKEKLPKEEFRPGSQPIRKEPYKPEQPNKNEPARFGNKNH